VVYWSQSKEVWMIRLLSLALVALLSLSAPALAQGCDDAPPPQSKPST
jgi:hypothetical protein